MREKNLDVLGAGNAIVDVLAKADDAFLEENKIEKGGMTLIDEPRALSIYDAMAPGVEISGGSVANSIACVASLGGQGGFVGKVANDALGDIFAHDLRAMGIEYETSRQMETVATGRSLINITPDAQRSMSTFLGAAEYLSQADFLEDQIKRSKIIFFEGYIFENPRAREGIYPACEIAHRHGVKTAITLSDAGCVERCFDGFHDLIAKHVDILLANEAETKALFQTEDKHEIFNRARNIAPLTAMTMSEHGSILIPRDGDIVQIDAIPPVTLKDTTGAGDAYAAGFLYGLSQDMDLPRAGALGSLAASEVISHFGARPEQQLKTMAQEAHLL